jgi:hypothetical protein
MKVYLKFNKTDTVGYMCLLSWLDIFKDHEIILVCDLFNVNTDPVPKFLKDTIDQHPQPIKLLNTDYSLSVPFNTTILDKRYQRAAAANLTCFKDNLDDPFFWLIDADDTMFLTRNFTPIKEKLKIAEEIIVNDDLDSLALDFYRMQNGTWSFGICLVKQSLDFVSIKNSLTEDDWNPKDTKCLDIWFDKLRRQNKLNLKSFVLDKTSFIHYVHKTKTLPYTLYEWTDNKLNGVPLPEDFIIL